MKEQMKSWTYILFSMEIFLIYITPSYYLAQKGLQINSLVFAVFLLGTCLINCKNMKYSPYEIIYILMVIMLVLYQRTLSPVVLLSPLVAYKNISKKTLDEMNYYLMNSSLIHIALIATIIYSIYYGLFSGRFLHTGLYEVNSSGLAILFLGFVYYKRKKRMGLIILFLGILSLSRNYVLALFVVVVMSLPAIKKLIKKYKLYNKLSFNKYMIWFAIVLYFLGKICVYKYSRGEIVNESTFWGRLTNFFDISNYLRFTTNLFLIDVFNAHPQLWIFGCDIELFRNLCEDLVKQTGQLYLNNNPHNFLFSYIKLYGITGAIDVLYAGKVLKRFTDCKNYFLIVSIFLYCAFLSIGANAYWLFMTVMLLGLYRNKDCEEN